MRRSAMQVRTNVPSRWDNDAHSLSHSRLDWSSILRMIAINCFPDDSEEEDVELVKPSDVELVKPSDVVQQDDPSARRRSTASMRKEAIGKRVEDALTPEERMKEQM